MPDFEEPHEVCDYGPNTDGPQEDCPYHGAEWARAFQGESRQAYELRMMITNYSMMFDNLIAERHKVGAEEYGQLTFLGNDVVRMMMEELADTANYCRYQFIKLMFLQEKLELKHASTFDAKPGEDMKINLGAQSFKGVGQTGWPER